MAQNLQKERVATSRSLRALQRALRNRTTPLFVLPICKGGLGPNPLLGELQCAAVTASGVSRRDQSMVGRSSKKVPTTERRRLNGIVIYTFWNIWKREKQKNFQQYRRDGATSGRKNQGGHRAKEEGFRLRLATSPFSNREESGFVVFSCTWGP